MLESCAEISFANFGRVIVNAHLTPISLILRGCRRRSFIVLLHSINRWSFNLMNLLLNSINRWSSILSNVNILLEIACKIFQFFLIMALSVSFLEKFLITFDSIHYNCILMIKLFLFLLKLFFLLILHLQHLHQYFRVSFHEFKHRLPLFLFILKLTRLLMMSFDALHHSIGLLQVYHISDMRLRHLP